MERIFLGFPPLPKALEEISELDDVRYQSLCAEVTGPHAFGMAESRVARLAQELQQFDEGDIVDLLQSLDFLYDRCREWELDDGGTEFTTPLRSFLKTTRLWKSLGVDPDAAFGRLVELLRPNPAIEQKNKLTWLRTGILENAVEFASFLDLRPDFTKDRMEIRGLEPVAIFRVRTESDFESDRSHVFQLTIDALRKLRKAVEDVDRKLETLGSSEGIARLLRKEGNQTESSDE